MGKRIDRVDTRATLEIQREPYWQRLTQGRSIGFRRISVSTPGTWRARIWNGERYDHHSLGDFSTLPEKDRFDAALVAADAWFKHIDKGGSTKRVTVADACEAYVQELQHRSENSATDAKGRFRRLVNDDAIATIELQKLAPRNVADWKKRALSKSGSKVSFNRNATSFRAALNLAHDRGDVASDHAWRRELRPFRDVGGRRELYLPPVDRQRLLNKAQPEARRFFTSLNMLPFRPGDVAKLKVENFDARHRALIVPHGKTKKRSIPLQDSAVEHFKECAKDKLPGAWLVSRVNGDQWDRFTWRDEIKAAAAAAELPANVCAYTFRHCVITDLVTGGLDIFTTAKLAGTSVTQIELHYGHLQREHAREALERLSA